MLVIKIKHNSIYSALLVVCGYSAVLGADFSGNYSIIMKNITFRILLLIMIKFSFSAKVVNIEAVFLYGEFEEEIYMECPPDMKNVSKNDCIILRKCMVQAASDIRRRLLRL